MSSPGDVWVENGELHFVDKEGTEWKYRGEIVDGRTAGTNSIWIEGETLHYVDADLRERVLPTKVESSVAGVMEGSIWIENSKITYVDENSAKVTAFAGTEDEGAPHEDKTHHQDHTDYVDKDHNDNGGHSDHSNNSHDDMQTGTYFGDHYDYHTNTHDNNHSNYGHNDHVDNSSTNHDDTYVSQPEEV